MARFLMVFCNSKQGYRDVNPPSIPEEITEDYHNLIKKMLKRTAKNKNIFLSKKAKRIYSDFQIMIEKKLVNEWHAIRNFAAKIPGTMLRIAGLLHCAKTENPDEENIDSETIKEAIDIIMYIAKNIEIINKSPVYTTGNFSKVEYVLKHIRELDQLDISKQEVYQICRGKIPLAEDLDKCLELLESHNYIKIITIKTNGRPKQKIILNPKEKYP